MFLNIMLVVLFLALMRIAYVLTHLARNQVLANQAENKRHSEIVLLLRGIKAVGVEQVDQGLSDDYIEAMRKHTEAMEELAFQMDMQ